MYEDIHRELSFLQQREVLNMTGCLTPCKYKEFKLIRNRKGFYSSFGVGISYGTTEISIEEEEWVYPEMSFLAEFGGALGMFLGFSFIMIWDFISYWLVHFNIFKPEACSDVPTHGVGDLGLKSDGPGPEYPNTLGLGR